MIRLSTVAVLAIAAASAACGRLGLSSPDAGAGYYPSSRQAAAPGAGQPIEPPPPMAPTVQSSSLPPLDGAAQPGYPNAAPTDLGAAPPPAVDPYGSAAPSTTVAVVQPVTADKARTLSMSDLAGDWALVSGADNCRVTMSLTTWAGGRRAASRGCSAPELQRISAWTLDGKQVVLKGADGTTVASLYSGAPEQFAGTTASRQPISLSR